MGNSDELHYNYLVSVVTVLIVAYLVMDHARTRTAPVSQRIFRRHIDRQLRSIERVRQNISEEECKAVRAEIEKLRAYIAEHSGMTELDREKRRAAAMRIPNVVKDSVKEDLTDIATGLGLLIDMSGDRVDVDLVDELIDAIKKAVCDAPPEVQLSAEPKIHNHAYTHTDVLDIHPDAPDIHPDASDIHPDARIGTANVCKHPKCVPKTVTLDTRTKKEFMSRAPTAAVRPVAAPRLIPLDDKPTEIGSSMRDDYDLPDSD
jgi:hypothetical protein